MLASIEYALNITVLVLLGLSPVLYLLIVWRSRGKQAQVRVAYLGYVVCALIVALFQLQVYASGGIAFMMIGLFLIPLVIAGGLAVGNTIGAPGVTLQVLGGTTVLVVLFLILTGVWGIAVAFTTAIAHAYEILVLVACIYRRCEWWPQSKRHDA